MNSDADKMISIQHIQQGDITKFKVLKSRSGHVDWTDTKPNNAFEEILAQHKARLADEHIKEMMEEFARSMNAATSITVAKLYQDYEDITRE